MLKHQLETYRWFPFAAWTICIGFALFVYHLTLNLKEAESDLAIAQNNLESNSKIDPQQIPIEQLQKTATTSNKAR